MFIKEINNTNKSLVHFSFSQKKKKNRLITAIKTCAVQVIHECISYMYNET